MTPVRSSLALVLVFCSAETLSMAGFALVPSLLPKFTVHWDLSATQGGWLSGIFFLGYILAVPLLVSLTDRLDARRVYLACAALSGLALAGYALFAHSFEAATARPSTAMSSRKTSWRSGVRSVSWSAPGMSVMSTQ